MEFLDAVWELWKAKGPKSWTDWTSWIALPAALVVYLAFFRNAGRLALRGAAWTWGRLTHAFRNYSARNAADELEIVLDIVKGGEAVRAPLQSYCAMIAIWLAFLGITLMVFAIVYIMYEFLVARLALVGVATIATTEMVHKQEVGFRKIFDKSLDEFGFPWVGLGLLILGLIMVFLAGAVVEFRNRLVAASLGAAEPYRKRLEKLRQYLTLKPSVKLNERVSRAEQRLAELHSTIPAPKVGQALSRLGVPELPGWEDNKGRMN